ncbi:CobW/HypB/UreG, nucleotide-binding domain-containing protein [Pterulicium gracile]|uniref:CobW/HypB/UreG, nucleotide-binding domain-containing protein n=1 Tax=Pterulicium gracile TaxID=1884261 RepID=A0A5C3QMG2_9AGAR|nr:CobW/HypB/UreG, nucleotide-binding domain-containing protein [Pterula gracilis]
MPIPITVFTGFLGAGKTSVILSLLPRLPADYKCCLLKNEFGDVEVDSKLAGQSSLTAVSEILNGCMCCVLVGQMKTALLEIKDKYCPDRIIIECSGSAFPATLAFQIRELEKETNGELKLDAIVTVVDAENFAGYEDTSPTARMQAKYTDIILINKWENVSERKLDDLIDQLNTLNDLTPKLHCQGRSGIEPYLLFGVDSKLFSDPTSTFEAEATNSNHHDEVETVTILKKNNESSSGSGTIDEQHLKTCLSTVPLSVIWRIKGFLHLRPGLGDGSAWYILNFAFGRFDLVPTSSGNDLEPIRVTVMGERGEVRRAAGKLAEVLGAEVVAH